MKELVLTSNNSKDEETIILHDMPDSHGIMFLV